MAITAFLVTTPSPEQNTLTLRAEAERNRTHAEHLLDQAVQESKAILHRLLENIAEDIREAKRYEDPIPSERAHREFDALARTVLDSLILNPEALFAANLTDSGGIALTVSLGDESRRSTFKVDQGGILGQVQTVEIGGPTSFHPMPTQRDQIYRLIAGIQN